MSKKQSDRQISVRLPAETDRWLESQAGGSRGKARVVRELIERERARQQEKELRQMFDRAANDITEEDRRERDLIISAFDHEAPDTPEG